MAELIVRRATRADLDAVVALRLALLREHHENPVYRRLRPDVEARARRIFIGQLDSAVEAIFLAVRDEAAVGILRCVQAGGSPLLYPSHYGYISSVYVVPAARRTGVLKQLLAAAIAWCRERGLPELRLHNAIENRVAAHTWEALGFRVVEELRLRPLTD